MDLNTLIGVAIGLAVGFLASIVLMQSKPQSEAFAPSPASEVSYGSR